MPASTDQVEVSGAAFVPVCMKVHGQPSSYRLGPSFNRQFPKQFRAKGRTRSLDSRPARVDLGRPPSTAELLLIEATAAQVVEARKLRRQGKSSEMQDRLVYRGLTRLGIKE